MTEKTHHKPSRIPKDKRKQAVRSIIIRNGGDFVIKRIVEELHELFPDNVTPDRGTISIDVYEVFDMVPKEIVQRQKSEMAKELLFTDSVVKTLLNKIKPDDHGNFPGVEKNDEVITILDAFRRHKEGKIKIAEAYGLKEKVADKIEHDIKDGIPFYRQAAIDAKDKSE